MMYTMPYVKITDNNSMISLIQRGKLKGKLIGIGVSIKYNNTIDS